jgi:hypothetical protein
MSEENQKEKSIYKNFPQQALPLEEWIAGLPDGCIITKLDNTMLYCKSNNEFYNFKMSEWQPMETASPLDEPFERSLNLIESIVDGIVNSEPTINKAESGTYQPVFTPISGVAGICSQSEFSWSLNKIIKNNFLWVDCEFSISPVAACVPMRFSMTLPDKITSNFNLLSFFMRYFRIKKGPFSFEFPKEFYQFKCDANDKKEIMFEIFSDDTSVKNYKFLLDGLVL